MGIISGLELVGMVSGGYIGYRYGNRSKDYVCKKYPVAERYRKEYISDKFKKSQISEPTMFNMVGSLMGMLGGAKAWFFVIPALTYQIAEDYPDKYKEVKKWFKSG